MTIRQKRAIYYSIREREEKNRYCFLLWKDLLNEFENSKYKSKLWFIRSKGLESEYNQACYYYGNKLENLPRKEVFK